MPTFLCGHGNWHVKDGYACVPAKTEVKFYTMNAKTLDIEEALKILNGTTGFAGDQCEIRGEFRYVPNMTLTDVGPESRARFELAARQRTDDYKLVFADKDHPKKLNDIMTFLKGEQLVWLACRKLALRTVSGKLNGEKVFVAARLGLNVKENPNTFYSAYVSSRTRPTDIEKKEFRGFMPAGWNIPKAGS